MFRALPILYFVAIRRRTTAMVLRTRADMDTTPLLFRFKKPVPRRSIRQCYDAEQALNMVEEDGRRIPFVRAAEAADAMKSIPVVRSED